MERLNKNVRTMLGRLLLDSDVRQYAERYVSYSPYDISRREYLHMKAHIHLCYLLTNALGYDISDFSSFNLSTEAFLTLLTVEEENSYDALFYDANDEIMDFYLNMESNAIDFLYRILAHTSWNVNFISGIYDIEILEDEEIKSLSSLLPYAIYSIKSNEDITDPGMLQEFECLKKRLSDLGVDCDLDYSEYDYMDSILYLSNSIVKKALLLCKENPKFTNLPEKREIEEYLSIPVIRRYYQFIENDLGAGDIAYILGTICQNREEDISTFTLSYESVFLLALAEMAAQDILDYAEKEG